MAASADKPAAARPWYLRRWSWLVALVALVGFIGALRPESDGPARIETAPISSSPSESPAPGDSAPSSAPPSPGTSASEQATGDPTAAQAAAVLATLPVKGRAPKTGYDRDLFGPAWTDDVGVDGGHNGCDTRNDVLRRDLVGLVLKPGSNGCVVLSGTLHDPYTATTITFTRGQHTSSSVQIDHVVALADAWQKGAQQLSTQQRVDFANDPLNLQATDGPINQAKGAGDAATWLPPNKAYRCTYVGRQVHVKAKYGLWVTAAERDAIADVLSSCGAPANAPSPMTMSAERASVPAPPG